MKNNLFPKLCKTLCLAMCLFVVPFVWASQPLREHILLDEDWRFAFGNASSPEKDFGCGTEYFNYLTKAASIHNAGPYSDKFDDSTWKRVDLPHDWVVDLPFDAQASHSHGYKTVGYRYPETSVGWYRKTFKVPAEDLGRHITLRFDGIFRDARIWVNGFYVGHEPSGYATQVYDITDYLNYGGENLILYPHIMQIRRGSNVQLNAEPDALTLVNGSNSISIRANQITMSDGNTYTGYTGSVTVMVSTIKTITLYFKNGICYKIG